MAISTYEKINITIPKDTLRKLEELIPYGARSAFIAQATEIMLREVSQRKAIVEAAGIWSERGEFATRKKIDVYLRKLRGTTRERQKRLRQ